MEVLAGCGLQLGPALAETGISGIKQQIEDLFLSTHHFAPQINTTLEN